MKYEISQVSAEEYMVSEGSACSECKRTGIILPSGEVWKVYYPNMGLSQFLCENCAVKLQSNQE